MGDRAFARARAAGKNETEAGHARAKAEANTPSAFQYNIGTRKMTRERNRSCTQPSRQPNAGAATDAHTPALPAEPSGKPNSVYIRQPPQPSPRAKSSQGLLFSEAKKPYAEAVGQCSWGKDVSERKV